MNPCESCLTHFFRRDIIVNAGSITCSGARGGVGQLRNVYSQPSLRFNEEYFHDLSECNLLVIWVFQLIWRWFLVHKTGHL